MIELGLEGKLIGKPQLLSRVNKEIQMVCNSAKPVGGTTATCTKVHRACGRKRERVER